VAKLRADYNYRVNTENVNEFAKLLDQKTLADSIFQVEIAKLDKPLFAFAGKEYSQADFASYLKNNNYSEKSIASEIINEKLNAFVEKEILAYEDSQLEKKYDDFRFLMQEYHDGILLFEVSNNEVWEKRRETRKD